MEKMGVESDMELVTLREIGNKKNTRIIFNKVKDRHLYDKALNEGFMLNGDPLVKTYDHAAIESIFPDWVFSVPLRYLDDLSEPIIERVEEYFEHHFLNDVLPFDCFKRKNYSNELRTLIKKIHTTRDQEHLEYMCDLALLLHDNGIELKKVEE
jgi:hypothetical protein